MSIKVTHAAAAAALLILALSPARADHVRIPNPSGNFSRSCPINASVTRGLLPVPALALQTTSTAPGVGGNTISYLIHQVTLPSDPGPSLSRYLKKAIEGCGVTTTDARVAVETQLILGGEVTELGLSMGLLWNTEMKLAFRLNLGYPDGTQVWAHDYSVTKSFMNWFGPSDWGSVDRMDVLYSEAALALIRDTAFWKIADNPPPSRSAPSPKPELRTLDIANEMEADSMIRAVRVAASSWNGLEMIMALARYYEKTSRPEEALVWYQRGLNHPNSDQLDRLALTITIEELRRQHASAPTSAPVATASVREQPAGTEVARHTFRVSLDTATSVQIMGDFNDWTPQSMTRDAAGIWVYERPLAAGRFLYLLLVDGEMRCDPAAGQAAGTDGKQVSFVQIP